MDASSSHAVAYQLRRLGEVAGPAVRPPTDTTTIKCTILFISFLILLGGLIYTGLAAATGISDTPGQGPEIMILENFSVSKLNITGDRIIGNWSVELVLENHSWGSSEITYSDIKYSVVYSSAPDVPIAKDLSLGHPLVSRPGFQIAVTINSSSEKLRPRHQIVESMSRDVIDNGVLKFNLIIVATIFWKDVESDYIVSWRTVLSCNDLKVLILPSKSASMNLSGRASDIPVCDIVELSY